MIDDTTAAAARARFADDQSRRAGGPSAAGSGVVEVVRAGPLSVVARARAHSPLYFRTPRNAGRAAWIYVATFGGGLVNGDRIAVSVAVGGQASAVLLTQGSAKIYRSPAGVRTDLDATVGDAATLIVMPDRVTCFAGARYEQRQQIDLASTASLLIVECLTAGRVAMGERWAFDEYVAATTISRAGRRVLADRIVLRQADGGVGERMRRFDAVATIVLTGPAVRDAAIRAEDRVRAREVTRRRDLIATTAVLGDGGTLVRIAARTIPSLVEEIGAILRPAVAPLGDDPARYRW